MALAPVALVAALAGSPGRGTAAGPCLPPGVTLPPGVPHPPPCPPTTRGPTAPVRVTVSGGVTATIAIHQGTRASCSANAGGWSASSGTTEINFGQPAPKTVRAALRPNKSIRHLQADTSIRMTFNPSARSQHAGPPNCALTNDPVSCSQRVVSDTETVTLALDTPRNVGEAITVALSPSAPVDPRCPAPFENGVPVVSPTDGLVFVHELDDAQILAIANRLAPRVARGASRTVSIEWREPRASCKKYGGPATPSSQGIVTLDGCTIEGDFRVVLTRLG
jgi:hypothetical protein